LIQSGHRQSNDAIFNQGFKQAEKATRVMVAFMRGFVLYLALLLLLPLAVLAGAIANPAGAGGARGETLQNMLTANHEERSAA
jgi:hypothetical protein